jgi:Domain of unknown function (DUF5655)/Domain of unknown function (DUF4287)
MAKTSAAKSPSIYGVHPGVAMVRKSLADLKEKTGRSLEEWIVLVRKEAPKGEKEQREWLKTKHKLGMNTASWIAERADGDGGDFDSPERYLKAAVGYVREQYAGPKEMLIPIYEELLELGKSMGADVKACPCKTMVPLYRNHVFAQIKPTTNTRIDLGFALAAYKGKLPKRVIDTGGLAKKDRITHRMEIKSGSDLDDEVKKWLKTAYELDA